MNFYVFQQDFENPEAHLLDIFVGPEPPKIGDISQLKKFNSVNELHEFLKTVKMDQVSTFRHPLCPRDLVEELNNWLELNLSLNVINQAGVPGA